MSFESSFAVILVILEHTNQTNRVNAARRVNTYFQTCARAPAESDTAADAVLLAISRLPETDQFAVNLDMRDKTPGAIKLALRYDKQKGTNNKPENCNMYYVIRTATEIANARIVAQYPKELGASGAVPITFDDYNRLDGTGWANDSLVDLGFNVISVCYYHVYHCIRFLGLRVTNVFLDIYIPSGHA